MPFARKKTSAPTASGRTTKRAPEKNKLGFVGKQLDPALQVVAKSTSKTFHLLDKGFNADHLDVSKNSLAPVELTAIAIKYEVNWLECPGVHTLNEWAQSSAVQSARAFQSPMDGRIIARCKRSANRFATTVKTH